MDRQTGKLISRIAENLPDMSSDIMQGWIENPRALQKFLASLSPPETSPEFQTWKTIKLGTGLKTADDFRRVLRDSCRIGDGASDILGKPAFTVCDTEMELDLVRPSVAELGFKDGATFKDICERGLEYGLKLCPAEVGPQLRLQYRDQPLGEWLIIAMKAIRYSAGDLSVFSVERYDNGLWLSGYDGSPDYFWFSLDRFVFVRPRK
ncbi:MAG: hypothetical protein AAB417_01075 [Patescibacteria group bacterium]